MEERLAEDVRREAARQGRVLVAREVLPSSEQASATIQDFYETLSGARLYSGLQLCAVFSAGQGRLLVVREVLPSSGQASATIQDF